MGEIVKYSELSRKIPESLMKYLSRGDISDDIQRGVIEDAILAAEGRAKAELGVNFALPIDNADDSAALKLAVSRITIHILWSDHPDVPIPDKVERNYELAIEYLKALKTNETTLGLDDTDEAAERADINVTFSRG